MIRCASAVVLVITLNPSLVRADGIVLTVNVPSAEVYKGPSTVTPVIGHVSNGTALPVLRNLGSWLKVAWPAAQDGVGYVHVTKGHVGPAVAPASGVTAATPRAYSAAEPVTRSIPMLGRTSFGEQVVPRSEMTGVPSGQASATSVDQVKATQVTPITVAPLSPVNVVPSHIFGVGGLVESAGTVGATARAWSRNRVGIQFGFTRDVMTSDVAAGRVTSMQIEPGVVFGLFDHVSDFVWLRPYVGSGLSVQHQTLSPVAPVPTESSSNNGVGYRLFAGSEVTFASMPRVGLTADVGYRRYPTVFPGFDPKPLSVSIGAHWYIK
jgi:hypothetical protein